MERNPQVFVLLTAMPPTTGHLQLIQFAREIAANEAAQHVVILLNTQPHEPMVEERAKALRSAVGKLPNWPITLISHYSEAIKQDPEAPGFWDMWVDIMHWRDFEPGDIIVASEPYGQKLAELLDGKFFPYDIDRQLNWAKAERIRNDPKLHFDEMLPEFSKYLRTTVTIFGAESTGKTTLSQNLAASIPYHSHWLFEYARPYLENTVNEITVGSMTDIWHGQLALQKQVDNLTPKPIIIQDTDLFSTVGYWSFPHWQSHLGECPAKLISDALYNRSDMYIVTPSNIPFEADPLRYGGDVREGDDHYWIKLLNKYALPYHVLQSDTEYGRRQEAAYVIHKIVDQKLGQLAYDRKGL